MEGRGVAAGKSAAADLGAYICFEDEAGQGLRPPKARTWAPRGRTAVMRARGGNRGWASVAGVVCFTPGGRAHLFYRLHMWRGRNGERKSFAWTGYPT
ncbi:hypothetical protein San01_50560 [Streptomyces angustmyceticus]|uniref:Uncharacterized protein n=1 Tax=Streptomyces angustmyceticus TaxID=285578 RepID=A0A5J4LM47_9ACTN|nr:hypothetical protein San01_50560 [Streptomyces angustmyceticus]